jgi:Ni,Fe-hydrogenase III small subunit
MKSEQTTDIELALCTRIKQVLGSSLHIRHVDAGSCNGCDFEMMALCNPVYDIQRFGIDFVASPRHADMLLVTGGVTRHLEMALEKTYAAAAAPKMVVAVGSCACGGGVCGQTYANAGGVDKIVPVDVFVPGCPPRPSAILEGILLALDKLDGSRSAVR